MSRKAAARWVKLHLPVFDLQALNPPELVDVVRDNDQAMDQRNRRDLQVVGADGRSGSFQRGANAPELICRCKVRVGCWLFRAPANNSALTTEHTTISSGGRLARVSMIA